GTVHTITALPAPGFVFSNWTGDIASRLAKLTFVMRSNLTLQANFIPNPFPKVQGAYHGLFYVEDATNGVRHETSGFLTLNLSGRGTYSGQLLSAGKRYPFVGQLDLGGNATNTVKRSGTNDLLVELTVDLSQGTDRIDGQVRDAQALWAATLMGDRAPVFG